MKQTFIALLLLFAPLLQYAQANQVHIAKWHMQLQPNNAMVEVQDSLSENEHIFVDTAQSIIMMISCRKGPFKSVKDYMDCTREELEYQLKLNFGDSTLQLLSCDRSAFYPKKATLVRFHVSILPMGYTNYSIYFIHHRRREIQISFTYKEHPKVPIQSYIDSIMATLNLN